MGYRVLYRKYRPSNFSEIIDQKFITDTLRESIKNNKISHAYIFSGPKGTGKTSTAKVFAKAINCENPIDGEPCGKCNSCLNFGSSPDIIELDAASNNKVEDIREIINNVKLAPTGSKYKVYIIDEVHMLTNSASNAFLLTLEEPPAHAVFILATTNPESLPLTILSRCQQFAFSKISDKALCDRLNYVLKEENIELGEDIINEICSLSDGGLRDALSLLDQLITLNKPITIDLLTEQFGVVSDKHVEDLLNFIISGDLDSIKKIFNLFIEYGISENSFVKKFIHSLTTKICKLKENNELESIDVLKKIAFEVIGLDLNRSSFNYFDIIEMIIASNISVNTSNNISREIKIEKKEVINNENAEESRDEKILEANPDKNEENDNNEYDDELIINESNNEEIIKIRINNAFADASKNCKLEFEKLFSDSIDKFKKDNDIYSLIVDSFVGVVSPTNAMIVCDSEASADLLNQKVEKIDAMFDNNTLKLVFVDKDKWNSLAEEYKMNKLKKIKYTYIEEPQIDKSNEIERLANNIFGDSIVMEEN